ncbi:stage II sporulation protein AB (anti-sigma F factor) [Desulfotomaculum arcticum]|uniref:Anti-sigma F factor n=1 Tax=Desulfotruncus arcticus DSM 17038 TaxID=1121424 RepID=A0A1I2MXU7_9FIRM|nr:anti-sigma F factor [Desulfotruncus arcticus]SFF94287.1 stage II sporulation protein AB (anti-sigma F factor) [Desulfotomaculum arcticum] [Desulfotruncus arcticus DSM 17038]
MNKAVIEFSSRAENVAFARVAVTAFVSQLDFTLSELEELKVAVSEAVSNAIVHGYASDPDQNVRLEIRVADNYLEIETIDTGRGIDDIAKALEPAYSTDPERMGLGFAFMQSFMDKLDVKSEPGRGTRVKMVRKVRAPGRAAVREH